MDCDEDYTRNDDDYSSSDDDCSAMTDGCDNQNEPCCSQDMLKRSAASHGFAWIKGKIQADSGIPARCYTKHDSPDPAKHEHFEIRGFVKHM